MLVNKRHPLTKNTAYKINICSSMNDTSSPLFEIHYLFSLIPIFKSKILKHSPQSRQEGEENILGASKPPIYLYIGQLDNGIILGNLISTVKLYTTQELVYVARETYIYTVHQLHTSFQNLLFHQFISSHLSNNSVCRYLFSTAVIHLDYLHTSMNSTLYINIARHTINIDYLLSICITSICQ